MRKRIDTKVQGELVHMTKVYARKAPRKGEPNDRRYDRKVEKLMKTLSPEVLSQVLYDDEPEPSE